MDDGSSFPCSIKIRIDKDMNKTLELCKRAQQMGCDSITVHGRLRSQKNEGKPDLDAIKMIKQDLSIPVFGNGGVETLDEAREMASYTQTDGIMVAQGLLQNPALFAGHSSTPRECVERFVEESLVHGSNLFLFQHHLAFMLDSQMSRGERRHFNTLSSTAAILEFLRHHHWLY